MDSLTEIRVTILLKRGSLFLPPPPTPWCTKYDVDQSAKQTFQLLPPPGFGGRSLKAQVLADRFGSKWVTFV